MSLKRQGLLFAEAAGASDRNSTTFGGNLRLPVHRWFRYSAGFSAEWAESAIREQQAKGRVRVFDPFSGSGTTLLAAEFCGAESWGIDSHPFVARIAAAKLEWRSDPDAYLERARLVDAAAQKLPRSHEGYPDLIGRCYDPQTLGTLDALRRAHESMKDDSAASELAWLTMVGILRRTSGVGTAQWQYVLPKKNKKTLEEPMTAFRDLTRTIYGDMLLGRSMSGPRACFACADARDCEPVPTGFADFVLTSPPYPNNYDYADATRLEMSFLGEVQGWGDLQSAVRSKLVRSCSQHVTEKTIDLDATLEEPCLEPIRGEIAGTCRELATIREGKGGRKTYHLMVACYFRDLALVWTALRRVCSDGATVCFVIGDSAPYGVYVPVMRWMSALAVAAGFHACRFEKTRDRNVKWKNRKHRVPLQEGRLWVQG